MREIWEKLLEARGTLLVDFLGFCLVVWFGGGAQALTYEGLAGLIKILIIYLSALTFFVSGGLFLLIRIKPKKEQGERF